MRFALLLLMVVTACAAPDDGPITGVGALEAIEEDVAPTSAARLLRVFVQEGDSVAQGDTIAVLTIPTLNADRAQARATVAVARAALAELTAGSRREEIARARAELAAREAELRRLVDDSTRIAPVVANKLAPEQQLVSARNAVLSAAALRDAAAASLALAVEGPRVERIAAARAEVARAEAVAASLDAVAGDLVLVAGAAGLVIGRHAEPGEMVPAGRAIVTIAAWRRPWVRVFLGPEHLPLVQVGDTVTAVLDALPDQLFTGRVTAIATRAEYTPRVALTEQERADQLFGVRVEFVDSTGYLKAGLPVTVTFARQAP
jgi:HlyD family secretion protein